MKIYRALIYIFVIINIIFSTKGTNILFIEDLDIASGAANDIKLSDSGELIYEVPICMYIFGNGKVSSEVFYGRSTTIAKTRDYRQRYEGKRFLPGSQKVTIFSEKYAKYGIKNVIDILFTSPTTQDYGVLAICKDKPDKFLKKKIKGYPSSPDFIERLIKSESNFNFFSEQYKVMDVAIGGMSEGRSVSVPYIEIANDKIKITGLAIFNNFKMVEKLDMNDSKIMNILKEDNVRGNISIEKNNKQYADCYCKSKRKVKCIRDNDKYNFIINIKLTGQLSDNELYKGITSKEEVRKKLEKDLAKKLQNQCYQFINKMKTEYKIDMIELGRVAAATYGRKTNVNWNEIVSKSNIKINVKVDINTFGRGDY